MTAKAKCDWGGCGRPGEYQIGLKIWALATPPAARTSRNAMKMLTSVCVCRECKPNVKVSDFTLPEMRVRVDNAMLRMGKAAADWGSAELAFEDVIDAPVDPEATVRAARLMGKPVWEG